MSTASATRATKIVPRLPISPEKGNEILGFMLGALVLLLFGSLLSYHPADPSWLHQTLDQDGDRVRNFVGPFGAQIAAFCFSVLGLVSFLLPVLLALEAWARLTHRGRSDVAGRNLGIAFILFTLPALLQLTLGAMSWRGAAVDAGGALGKVLSGALASKLNFGGAFVVLAAVLMVAGTLVAQSTLKDVFGVWREQGAGVWRRGLLAWAQRDKRRKERSRTQRVWDHQKTRLQEDRRRGERRRPDPFALPPESEEPELSPILTAPQHRSPRVVRRGFDYEDSGIIEPLPVREEAKPIFETVEDAAPRRSDTPVRVTEKKGPGGFAVRRVRPTSSTPSEPVAEAPSTSLRASGGFRPAAGAPAPSAVGAGSPTAPAARAKTLQPFDPPPSDELLPPPELGALPDTPVEKQVPSIVTPRSPRPETTSPAPSPPLERSEGAANAGSTPSVVGASPVQAPSAPPPATSQPSAAQPSAAQPAAPQPSAPQPAPAAPVQRAPKPPLIQRKPGAPPATTPPAGTGMLKPVSAEPVPGSLPTAPAAPVQEDLGLAMDLPELPPVNLLTTEKPTRHTDEAGLVQRGEIIHEACKHFGVSGEIAGIGPGPVITVFEFQPAPGVKVSKVVNLQDDLALALKADSVRIDRIAGRSTMGMEVPNQKRSIIHLGQLLSEEPFRKAKSVLTMALGVDIHGRPVYFDLATMPHLLVAGATGAGKSVGLQSMITSILYKANKDEVKFIFIDPKRVELGVYSDIPHLKTEVVVEPKKAANALRWAVSEMERRYRLLAEVHVRSIDIYNRAIRDPEERRRLTLEEGKSEFDAADIKPLPYYVIIIDELADLMMVASSEVETSIARLAQMARAVGIHLIVATQRPSVDVLTGTIKANFPCRLAFATATRHDSRTILDQVGAEKLLGKGDALFMPPGTSRIMRLHGAYISEQETAALIRWLRKRGKPDLDPDVVKPPEDEASSTSGGGGGDADPLFEDAARLVVRERQGSASFLQRRMRVGFSRAARLIDMLEADGILGPAQGSKPRDVLVPVDFFEEIEGHKGAVEE